MEIDGKVTTGYGKAAYFLGQEFYKEKFEKKCGFTPFPGTLNIIIPKSKQNTINTIKDNCNNIIKPNKDFGGVKYVKATLNNEIEGAIIFPEKTTHEIHYLEFISKDKLREKLNLKDGDIVTIKFND